MYTIVMLHNIFDHRFLEIASRNTNTIAKMACRPHVRRIVFVFALLNKCFNP